MGMLFWVLFLGVIAGFSVALPYGPVGFVMIRRFYLFGMNSGMYSAFGGALSDAFYAIVVGFGLHRISQFLLSIASYAEIVAGGVLIYIGIRAMRHKLHLNENEEENHPIQDVASTFLLNFLNPTLIFSFALVFTILNKILHGVPMTFGQTSVFVSGTIIGACLVWFLIGKGIHYLRMRNRDELVQKINYVTGAILVGLGVIVLMLPIVYWIFK